MSKLELKRFDYADLPIRTVTVDGNPWFVLADVGKVLKHSNPRVFLDSKHCDPDGVSKVYITDSLNREQETTIINEGNLFAMIARSDTPGAVAFQKWVNHDVLPQIRKTGQYSALPAIQEPSDPILASISQTQRALEAIVQTRQEQLAMKEDLRETRDRLRQLENVVHSVPTDADVTYSLIRAQCRKIAHTIGRLSDMNNGRVFQLAYKRFEKELGISLDDQVQEKAISKMDWITEFGYIHELHGILRNMEGEAREHKAKKA